MSHGWVVQGDDGKTQHARAVLTIDPDSERAIMELVEDGDEKPLRTPTKTVGGPKNPSQSGRSRRPSPTTFRCRTFFTTTPIAEVHPVPRIVRLGRTRTGLYSHREERWREAEEGGSPSRKYAELGGVRHFNVQPMGWGGAGVEGIGEKGAREQFSFVDIAVSTYEEVWRMWIAPTVPSQKVWLLWGGEPRRRCRRFRTRRMEVGIGHDEGWVREDHRWAATWMVGYLSGLDWEGTGVVWRLWRVRGHVWRDGVPDSQTGWWCEEVSIWRWREQEWRMWTGGKKWSGS